MKDNRPKNYVNELGQSYSILADFNKSQDHALLKKSYSNTFNFGHAYEAHLMDAAKGTTTFFDEFFVSEVGFGSPPEKIIKALGAGDNLSELEVFTKSGERSKTHKSLHRWIDSCLENPGKTPISQEDFGIIKKLTENMLKMEILGGVEVGDILSVSEWQKECYWDTDGIKKKALADCFLQMSGSENILIDIKTSANKSSFYSFLKSRYWVQDVHYWSGFETVYGDTAPMIFLVAFKEMPYLCQAFSVEPTSRAYAMEKYHELCTNYDAWIRSGKPAKGWIPQKDVKIYFEN